MTHIYVSDLTSIGSDNGLSPGRRQAIIRTNAGILLITPLGTNFSEFLVEIVIFSFKKMRLKVSSAKWRPFCLGLNVLIRGCVLLWSDAYLFYHYFSRLQHLHLENHPNELFHKSHNVPVPYPIMHRNVHISLFWMMHCGTWNRWIVGFVKLVYRPSR